jgi:hypothetical protein
MKARTAGATGRRVGYTAYSASSSACQPVNTWHSWPWARSPATRKAGVSVMPAPASSMVCTTSVPCASPESRLQAGRAPSGCVQNAFKARPGVNPERCDVNKLAIASGARADRPVRRKPEAFQSRYDLEPRVNRVFGKSVHEQGRAKISQLFRQRRGVRRLSPDPLRRGELHDGTMTTEDILRHWDNSSIESTLPALQ